MDIVFIRDLKLSARIGVWEWEQQIKQNLVIDLDLGTDIRKAGKSDELADAINYKNVALRVSDYVSSNNHRLIEAVAENIATIILSEFDVIWCKVKVTKPRAVEKSKSVGVIITREKEAAV